MRQSSYFRAAAAYLASRQPIENEIVDTQDRGLRRSFPPPRQNIHARIQFRKGKRLDQIIAAAAFKSRDPIGDGPHGVALRNSTGV